ncbi:fimbria/pilus periplasmic chaperone, partial [Escherichia coli]
VLEVPPKPDADKVANQSLLQLAFRTRIKLFYRPEGLNGLPSDAPAALKWSWATSAGKTALRVANPTPYHVSFSSGDLVANGKTYPLDVKMVAPLSEETFDIKGMSGKASSAKVHFFAINDFGGAIEGNASL